MGGPDSDERKGAVQQATQAVGAILKRIAAQSARTGPYDPEEGRSMVRAREALRS